jgi:hypothetical protein
VVGVDCASADFDQFARTYLVAHNVFDGVLPLARSTGDDVEFEPVDEW